VAPSLASFDAPALAAVVARVGGADLRVRRRCSRRRRQPPRPPAGQRLPPSTPSVPPSFLPRRPPVTRAPASTPLRPSLADWSGSGLVWVQQRVVDAAKGERTFRGMVASRAEGTNAAWIQGRGRRSSGDLGPGCGEEEEKGKKVLTLFFFYQIHCTQQRTTSSGAKTSVMPDI
jgi:hypothetical protein